MWMLAALVCAAATSARADGFKAWTVCGGNAFNTCASVSVNVVGTNVTMRVWNLSGLHNTYGGTVFTGIGLFNVPTNVNAIVPSNGLVTGMSGPTRGSNTPSAWRIQNNTQIGGGMQLDLVGRTPNGVNNGIASNCLPGALPGGQNQLWMNPTCGTAGVYSPPERRVRRIQFRGHAQLGPEPGDRAARQGTERTQWPVHAMPHGAEGKLRSGGRRA
jgi:hypothetical protein